MDYRFSILVKKPEMLSALSTVSPPTLFVNLLFLKVSTCRWVCFPVLLHLGETRDNYSTLMPLRILSFGWAFSSHLSLLYSVDIWLRVRHSRFNWELPLPPSFFIYVYISMGRVLSGDLMVSRTAHTFLFPNHTPSLSTRLCFDSSLTYLAVALSLVQYDYSV